MLPLNDNTFLYMHVVIQRYSETTNWGLVP